MSKIDDYIFPLEEYISNSSWNNQVDDIFFKLLNAGQISTNLSNTLKDVFIKYINIYSDAGFNVIPIFNENMNIRVKILLNYILQEFLSSNYLLSSLTIINRKVNIANLDSQEHFFNSENGDESFTSNRKKVITKTNDETKSTDNKSMVENAPYNNSIDNIDSPSGKNHYKSLTNNTNTIDETEDNTDNNSGDFNKDSNSNKSSPLIFKEYIELLKEYDIFSIINRIIRKFLYEFNRVF